MLEVEDLGALGLASAHIYTIGQWYAPNASNKSYSGTPFHPHHFLARPRSFARCSFVQLRLPVPARLDAAILPSYSFQHLLDCTDGKTTEWWFLGQEGTLSTRQRLEKVVHEASSSVGGGWVCLGMERWHRETCLVVIRGKSLENIGCKY